MQDINLCRRYLLAHQAHKFEDLNNTINADIAEISEFGKRWRLQPNVAKRMSSTYHLHKGILNQELQIILNGKRLKHDNMPTCIGVMLACTLIYKPHILGCKKTRTRNNLVHMLAGTTWGLGQQKNVVHQPCPSAILWLSTVLQFGGNLRIPISSTYY